LASLVPWLADRAAELQDWDQINLLTVRADRLTRWYAPGFLAIGDAAHAMSPVAGVGINVAIQDAVAAANVLWRPLRAGAVPVRGGGGAVRGLAGCARRARTQGPAAPGEAGVRAPACAGAHPGVERHTGHPAAPAARDAGTGTADVAAAPGCSRREPPARREP